MRRLAALALLLAVALPGAVQAAAQSETLYVESRQAAVAQTTRQLRAYAAAAHAEPGMLAAILLHEVGRPERFAVYEVWRDEAALAAHLAAPARKGLDAALATWIQAPIDDRLGSVLASMGESPPASSLFILTHIDVAPPGAPAITEALKGQAVAAPGLRAFQLSGQTGRSNHFTLAHAWADQAAFSAFAASEPARKVREQIAGVKGALYDERLYRAD